MMPVAGISAKSETDATSAAGKSASRDVRAGVDQHAEIPLLARLEQQREDRRAWAAALLAAERAAAMAAALNQSVLVDPDEKVDPFDMSRAPEVQRQLDAALRIVRMRDTAGLRFELRL